LFPGNGHSIAVMLKGYPQGLPPSIRRLSKLDDSFFRSKIPEGTSRP
jgi:hypothetical protein